MIILWLRGRAYALALGLLFAVLPCLAAPAAAALVTYPSPGSLTSVTGLSQSPDYTVQVNGINSFVYRSSNVRTNGPRRPEAGASFTNFSFSNQSVTVVVTCTCTVSSATIRPLDYGVQPVINGNTVTFTLSTPRKLSVEINGRSNPLFIFADAPETNVPTQGSPGVVYFGPGVHNIGANYAIQSNQTIYLAGGAVVAGTLRAPDDSTNITIRGRGILAGGNVPWVSGADHPGSIWVLGVTGLTVEGITIVDSPGWTIRTAFRSADIDIQNTKHVNWIVNTDGPWSFGDDVLVANNFIFNNDDATVIHKGSNITFRDNIIWSGILGRAIMLWDLPKTNVNILNNIVIGRGGTQEPVIELEPSGRADTGLSQNVTFDGFVVEQHGWRFITADVVAGGWQNLKFKNVRVFNRNAAEGSITGTSAFGINGLEMQNVWFGGRLIASLSQANLTTNSYVQNVTFPNPAIYDLISNNFDNGTATGWTATGAWSVASDGSNVYRSPSVTGESVASAGNTLWQNYFVQGNVKILSAAGSSGILGRYVDANNYYMLRVHESLDRVQLYKRTTANGFVLLDDAALAIDVNQWNTLRLVMNGGAIQGWVNGVLRVQATDASPIATGKIGLRAFDSATSFDAVGAGHLQ